jgi:hypothetical protein
MKANSTLRNVWSGNMVCMAVSNGHEDSSGARSDGSDSSGDSEKAVVSDLLDDKYIEVLRHINSSDFRNIIYFLSICRKMEV